MTAFSCGVCAGDTLRDLPAYAKLPRVTSDCKPWPAGGSLTVCTTCGTIQKRPDAKWLEEIDRIYGAYQIYHLSDGGEQVIFFADGTSCSRSSALVNFVVTRVPDPGSGTLIDIGCGNGSALANFSAALPGWTFDGTELSDRDLARFEQVPGFRSLHTGKVEGRYDVVSMIHSLEHMVSPFEALSDAASHLQPEGTLFVEVPDAETSPFDMLVADHRTHFTRATLGALAGRLSLAVDVLQNTVLPKENTLLARLGGHRNGSLPDPQAGERLAERTIAWLNTVVDAARAAVTPKFGIFGTSISGMWLYGALRDQVAFFVDEDRSRVGRTYEGRPIHSPDEAPRNSVVFIPMAKATADRIAARLGGGGATYVTPPSMDGRGLA
jgi:hypothetical protein